MDEDGEKRYLWFSISLKLVDRRRRRHRGYIIASSGRYVAPPWPRSTACFQRLAGTKPVSLRSWSVQRT